MIRLFIQFLIPLCLLASCGFQPIYGDVKDNNIEIASYLSGIKVKSPSGELGQRLSNMLEDKLNPQSEQSIYADDFILEIKVRSDSIPLVIQQDGSINRYSTNLISNFRLYDANKYTLLHKGTLQRTASYNNLNEKFASYIAERDAIDGTLKELAEDYKLRLAGYFASHYEK